jgi:hypothetical protein
MSAEKYSEYKVEQLKKECEKRGIKGYSRKTKLELINILEEDMKKQNTEKSKVENALTESVNIPDKKEEKNKETKEECIEQDNTTHQDRKKFIEACRELVQKDYDSAKALNLIRHMKGDAKATSQYSYDNQIHDALKIVDEFYFNDRRVISVQKKTKVGADNLMIEIIRLSTTHPDDKFAVNPDNVRIITGMSNVTWENDMKDKSPSFLKDKIFHHGKLPKAELKNLNNALIIIDEIDTGDKEGQVLHTTLKEAGVLDVEYMKKHNIRFVFISATMIKELYDLYRWGELHKSYTMTIPPSYIGHKDFLEMKIIKEFYPLDNEKNAEKWVQEDIIDNYGNDYKVHIARVNKKTLQKVQNACIRKGITFRNHFTTDKLSKEDEKEYFEKPLNGHIVLGIKGYWRRASLIPNRHKLRIGATHELHTKKVDNNVQTQGLLGRMTGHWRDDIEKGHKTGPHRTSIKAIEEYEKTYNDPFGDNSYQTSGFKKKNGEVSADYTMLSSKNIQNLDENDLPLSHKKGSMPVRTIDITEEDAEKWISDVKYRDKYSSDLLEKYYPDDYKKYKDYKRHCWVCDTPDKYKKWGIEKITKPNAYSVVGGLKENEERDEKREDVLMIFLYENKLIFNPWNGTSLNN